MLLFVGLCGVAAILAREFLFVSRFAYGTNENVVSFADDSYLEPALSLDFSFEPEGNFGVVHLRGIKKLHKRQLHESRPMTQVAQAEYDIDFWVEVTGTRKWLSKHSIDDAASVKNELLPQIEREIDRRLGGNSGVKFEKSEIARALEGK